MTTVAGALLRRVAAQGHRQKTERGHSGRHQHRPQPDAFLQHAFFQSEMPSFFQLVEGADEHDAIEHRHPEEGDEARYAEGMSRAIAPTPTVPSVWRGGSTGRVALLNVKTQYENETERDGHGHH